MESSCVRDVVVAALTAIFDEDREADRVLDRALRRHRELDSIERSAVARRVLGIACLRGRIDHRLDQCCAGWRGRPHAFRLATYVRFEEGRDLGEAAAASGLEMTELRGFDEPTCWPSDAVDRLAAQQSLPRWLAERWHVELGDGAHALVEAMNRPGPVVVRANALKIDREALRNALAAEGIDSRPTARSPWGLTLIGRANVFGCRAWREGLFEVQDEGSQLIALSVGARPGERVIDFCAGAGGKTLALAAMMEDRGEIVALDPDPSRLINLAARVRRAGVSVVRTRRVDPGRPLPEGIGNADRVLVDAPCSSLGTLRRSPDLRWRLAPGSIAELAALQREILDRASDCVRPGGLLVYATCTLTNEENEGVAEAFAASHPEWATEGTPLRLLPHVDGTDGFFACQWRRETFRGASP